MRTVFRFIVLFLLLPASAIAASDEWRVEKATSQVRYTTDRSSWVDLRSGDTIPNRAWIATGPRGRAQLVRGVERIGFQPNTVAAITTKPGGVFATRKTEIVQQVGTLDLEIEKRSQPHTTVQTPYLAAVVKGTIFHVDVNRSKASVSVDRGLVQVTSFASGQQTNVGPRQSATVDKRVGMSVDGAITRPSISTVAPTTADVPAVGTTKLSGQNDATDDKEKSTNGANDASADTADDSMSKEPSGKDHTRANGNRRGDSQGNNGNGDRGSDSNGGKSGGSAGKGNGGANQGKGGGTGEKSSGTSGSGSGESKGSKGNGGVGGDGRGNGNSESKGSKGSDSGNNGHGGGNGKGNNGNSGSGGKGKK